jgi:hypothetical protein
MFPHNDDGEDHWRPLPKHRKGHGLATIAGLLALAVAGCGSATPVIHNPKPASTSKTPGAKATSTASPTPATVAATAPINCAALPASSVSVAEGVSNSYTFNIPSEAMPKGASFAYAGNTAGGDKGSPVWIANNWMSYIPHIPVVNDTNGAVSNCTAQEWGYGFLKMTALADWAAEYGVPELEESTAAFTGSAPEFYGTTTLQNLIAGDRFTFTGGIWPTKLILVSLSASAQQDQQTSSKFAFIQVSPGYQTTVTTTTTQSGQTSKSSMGGSSNGGGLLAAGNYETNYVPTGISSSTWSFGPVFVPTSYQDCSSDGVTSAICGNAGVS